MFKKIKNKQFLFLFVVLFGMVAFLGVGYAQITGINLELSGTASLSGQTGIVISNISYSSSVATDPSESSINTYYQTMLDSTIVLGNDTTSSITYQITIRNLTDENYVFSNVVYDDDFYDNNNITYELNGISHGSVLSANQSVTFNVTFKYTGTDISNNTLNSFLNFKFKKENYVTVTFNTNGGSPVPSDLELNAGDEIGTLPTPTKEICASYGEGTPHDRGCTYVGVLVGWYLEPTFATQVDEHYVVNEDTVLYAKWHSTYEDYENMQVINFDGVDDKIDTGINLYSEDNINKDFELSFDVVDFDRDFIRDTSHLQVSLMNSKDESQSTYPGFVTRFNTGSFDKININYRWGSLNSSKSIVTSSLPIHFEFSRRNGIVYLQASSAAATISEVALYNQSSYTLTQYSPTNVVFGCSYNSTGSPFRFFKGDLANLSVVVHE